MAEPATLGLRRRKHKTRESSGRWLAGRGLAPLVRRFHQAMCGHTRNEIIEIPVLYSIGIGHRAKQNNPCGSIPKLLDLSS